MIAVCPKCRRSVSNGEDVRRFGNVWYPSADSDCHPSGPADRLVSNHLYFYCSVFDPESGRHAVLIGPYDDYDAAESDLMRAKQLAHKANPWSAFYAYGICSSNSILRPVFAEPLS